MADDLPKTPRPFDVQTVKYLVRLMGQHGLNEIDLREGDKRIRLLRGPREVTLPAPLPPIQAAPAAPPPPAAVPETARPVKAGKSLLEIKSPTPGTFYAAASPGAESFVRVGSKVMPSTVVCVIEAMKLFTEITADCTGVVAEVLVENQQPVEYNQVLFRVDPTG